MQKIKDQIKQAFNQVDVLTYQNERKDKIKTLLSQVLLDLSISTIDKDGSYKADLSFTGKNNICGKYKDYTVYATLEFEVDKLSYIVDTQQTKRNKRNSNKFIITLSGHHTAKELLDIREDHTELKKKLSKLFDAYIEKNYDVDNLEKIKIGDTSYNYSFINTMLLACAKMYENTITSVTVNQSDYHNNHSLVTTNRIDYYNNYYLIIENDSYTLYVKEYEERENMIEEKKKKVITFTLSKKHKVQDFLLFNEIITAIMFSNTSNQNPFKIEEEKYVQYFILRNEMAQNTNYQHTNELIQNYKRLESFYRDNVSTSFTYSKENTVKLNSQELSIEAVLSVSLTIKRNKKATIVCQFVFESDIIPAITKSFPLSEKGVVAYFSFLEDFMMSFDLNYDSIFNTIYLKVLDKIKKEPKSEEPKSFESMYLEVIDTYENMLKKQQEKNKIMIEKLLHNNYYK